MLEFSSTFCTKLLDGRYRLRHGLLNGLIEARAMIHAGQDRDAADRALLKHNWASDDVLLVQPVAAARSTDVVEMWDELKSCSDRKNPESNHENSVIVG